MTFEQYLTEKKINYDSFLWSNPKQYNDFKVLFNIVHPDSFTMQKKFFLNKLRMQYPISLAKSD